MYKTLGIISLILVIIITAPYWLRTLNSWTVKTKDKRFFNLLKFFECINQGHSRTGDTSGTRATVSLQYITVNMDGYFAKLF